jgi:peptidoglycan/LPS O-acetylase OafA/YrhL
MGLTVLSVVTFSHDLLMQQFGYSNYCLNVLWSLSVEEMFYFSCFLSYACCCGKMYGSSLSEFW